MRILLTGSAGFIGRVVLGRLHAAGQDVVEFDEALAAGSDITDLEAVRASLAHCDAVIHLAAKVGLGVDLADIDDYVRVNDLGTAMVLRAAAEAKISRIVYASSMVVYGEGAYACVAHGPVSPPPRSSVALEGGQFEPLCPRCDRALEPGLVAESAPLDPRNVYAATKVHGEHLAAAWARETGGSVAALRFHNVYGPGMPRDTPYAGVASLFRSANQAGQPAQVFEDGGQVRDFVHVHDVAAANVRALDAVTGAPVDAGRHVGYNVASGEPRPIVDLAARLAEVMGAPPPQVVGGGRPGDVRHIVASPERAARDLGFTAQVRFDDGVARFATDPMRAPAG